MHGTLDEYGSMRHPELIARSCKNGARLELMPDLHHVPHREKPGDVVSLVGQLPSVSASVSPEEKLRA
jgi:pimeloyl-ACP methyl ester carboxylesterase